MNHALITAYNTISSILRARKSPDMHTSQLRRFSDASHRLISPLLPRWRTAAISFFP